jgi:ankyrin repeat protein
MGTMERISDNTVKNPKIIITMARCSSKYLSPILPNDLQPLLSLQRTRQPGILKQGGSVLPRYILLVLVAVVRLENFLMSGEEMNLISAIEAQSLSAVRYLLQIGADPNYPITNLGMRPVHFAVRYHCPDILEELVHQGAVIDECSPMMTSVLQMAIQTFPEQPEVSLEMIRILTKDRHRLQNRDVLGEALQYACGMGYPSVVQLLLQANSDPNYYPPDDEFAMTPLIGMIFENERCEGHLEILQQLLAAGADLRHFSGDMTALDYAISYGRDDLIPLLQQPHVAKR